MLALIAGWLFHGKFHGKNVENHMDDNYRANPHGLETSRVFFPNCVLYISCWRIECLTVHFWRFDFFHVKDIFLAVGELKGQENRQGEHSIGR